MARLVFMPELKTLRRDEDAEHHPDAAREKETDHDEDGQGRQDEVDLGYALNYSVSDTSKPYTDGGYNEGAYGGSYGCQEAEGESDGHAPHEGQHEVAAQVVGAGEAIDLAVDDEAGVDVGIIFENESGGDEPGRCP